MKPFSNHPNSPSSEDLHTMQVREWLGDGAGESRAQVFSDTPEGYFETLPNRALAAVRFAQAADAVQFAPTQAVHKERISWVSELWVTLEKAVMLPKAKRWVPAFAILLVVGLGVIFMVPKLMNPSHNGSKIAANTQAISSLNPDDAFAAIPTDEALAYLDANPPTLHTLSSFLGLNSQTSPTQIDRSSTPRFGSQSTDNQSLDSLRTPSMTPKTDAQSPSTLDKAPVITDDYIKQLLQSAPDEALEEEVLLLL